MLVNRTVKRNVLVKRVKRFYNRMYKYHAITRVTNGNYLLFVNETVNNEEGD